MNFRKKCIAVGLLSFYCSCSAVNILSVFLNKSIRFLDKKYWDKRLIFSIIRDDTQQVNEVLESYKKHKNTLQRLSLDNLVEENIVSLQHIIMAFPIGKNFKIAEELIKNYSYRSCNHKELSTILQELLLNYPMSSKILSMLQLFTQMGFDVNKCDEESPLTLLMYSAGNNLPEIVRFLLENCGAHKDLKFFFTRPQHLKPYYNCTAAHIAVKRGHREIATYLDVYAPNSIKNHFKDFTEHSDLYFIYNNENYNNNNVLSNFIW